MFFERTKNKLMPTKDQIAKLSAEQQAMRFANVQLGRAQFRQKLLKEMRGLDRPWLTGVTIAGSLLMVLAAIYFDKKQSNPRLEFISVGTIVVALKFCRP